MRPSKKMSKIFNFLVRTLAMKETLTVKGRRSQNNFDWVGPVKVLWSKPCSKQGQLWSPTLLKQVIQGCVQSNSEYLQGWRLHVLSGNSCHAHLPCGEIFFLVNQIDFAMCCYLCPFFLTHSLSTSERSVKINNNKNAIIIHHNYHKTIQTSSLLPGKYKCI